MEVQGHAAGGLSAARPALIRALNEQLLLEHIRLTGPCSRADLARVSGLSKPTVSLALANLERAGLVRLAGQRTGVPGRSALLYEIRPEAGFVLGLDIGMQYLRGAVTDLAGVVRARMSRAVAAADAGAQGAAVPGPRERVAELVRLADDICAQAGISRSSVIKTVVGSPGVYNRQHDLITLSGGIPGWDQPEALTALRSSFGPSLTIENDVDASALAERARGTGKETDDFVFVHVGTGIGMGLVLGGRLYRGAHGVAGEIAYMPFGMADAGTAVDPAEMRRRGRLETAAAADGIVRAARRAGMSGDITARSVFEAAERGDARAAAVVAAEARLVASAICCVITVVDPSLVVLGGGVGQAPGFADAVRAELALIAPVMPEVRVSALGTEVVVDGCIAAGTALAWNQLVAALP
ncbi:MAG TPA: ROK family protein [Trebonia sp.]|nr:ROK family protein [Trebonia sp.]